MTPATPMPLKIMALAVICLLTLAAGRAWAEEREKPVRVAVAFSFNQPGRWGGELEAMKKRAADLGVELMVEVARDDQMRQNSQADKLLARRPDVLILTANDAAGAASIVKQAHRRGVKVIAYDRLVLNAGADIHLTFDSAQIGRLQAEYLARLAPEGRYILLSGSPADHNSSLLLAGAMEILGPLIESRRIKVVADGPVIGWESAEARAMIERALAGPDQPAAILAPNDQVAAGVIEALSLHGLAGQVPVSGQDADPAAVRRIMAGTQSMTVFKNPRRLAYLAVETAINLAGGQSPAEMTDQRSWDGSHSVPTIRLEPDLVDRSNLQRVLIDTGYMRYDQVYGQPNFYRPAR